MQVLRDLGFGKGSMEDRITEEIAFLIQRVDKTVGKPADIHSMLIPSISNIISQLVFGHRLETDDPNRVLLDELLEGAQSLFSPIGFFATSPKWFGKLALFIGSIGRRKMLKDVFSIFE